MNDKLAVELLVLCGLFLAVTCIVALSTRLEANQPALARLAEYDALLAECTALVPEGGYCELIVRERREKVQ